MILRVAVVITVTRDCHDAKYKCEHCEDVRLDNAHKQFQSHEWDDSNKRQQERHRYKQNLTGEHVSE